MVVTVTASAAMFDGVLPPCLPNSAASTAMWSTRFPSVQRLISSLAIRQEGGDILTFLPECPSGTPPKDACIEASKDHSLSHTPSSKRQVLMLGGSCPCNHSVPRSPSDHQGYAGQPHFVSNVMCRCSGVCNSGGRAATAARTTDRSCLCARWPPPAAGRPDFRVNPVNFPLVLCRRGGPMPAHSLQYLQRVQNCMDPLCDQNVALKVCVVHGNRCQRRFGCCWLRRFGR